MKPLLIVDQHAEEANVLAGKVYSVLLYKDAHASHIKDHSVLYWPQDPGGSGRAKHLAKFAKEVKTLISEGKTPLDFIAMSWGEFVEWAKPRVVEADYSEETVTDPAPTQTQKERVDSLGLACMSTGNPYCNAANVVKFLTRTPEYAKHIWFDEFQSCVMHDLLGGPLRWSDSDENELLIRLQDEFAFHRLNDSHVRSAVNFFAQQDKRHEVRDWIKTLTWDKTNRIGNFFPVYFGAAESPAIRAFSSNFWVLMLKRIFSPGCQADYMVVLEGKQGAGKTRAFQAIGGDWYAEVGIDASSQDFERQLQGRILVEISELHSFSKAEQSRVKQIITKRNDVWVEKYKEHSANHLRPCILVGTTNESEWIKDQTGGRRFWPVKCGTIDVQAIKRDRNQLFAEAYQRVIEGDQGFKLPYQETEDLQDQRREHDAWEEVLSEGLIGHEQISRLDALKMLGIPVERMDGKAERRVSYVLRQLGWEPKVIRIEEVLKRMWAKNGVTRNNSVTKNDAN